MVLANIDPQDVAAMTSAVVGASSLAGGLFVYVRDRGQARKRQAVLVYAWIEFADVKSGERQVIIDNSSDYPIFDVFLTSLVTEVQPLELDVLSAHSRHVEPAADQVAPARHRLYNIDLALLFDDAFGNTWERRRTKLKRQGVFRRVRRRATWALRIRRHKGQAVVRGLRP